MTGLYIPALYTDMVGQFAAHDGEMCYLARGRGEIRNLAVKSGLKEQAVPKPMNQSGRRSGRQA